MELPGPECSPEAREAFARYVALAESGEWTDLDSLCAERPALARELRALHQRWAELRGILGGRTSSADVVREAGEDRAAGGSTAPFAGRTEASFAATILARLLARGSSSGRYRLGDEIATGGQGAVLRVWDEDLHRHLAMKVLLPGPSTPEGERALGRFLEEAQVTGQLDHPGIVPVHELGLDSEGRVYFTMKLVKGRTLKEVFELVARGEAGWTRTRVLSILLKLCEAMAYAHSKGVVHRDLKPGNVMVGRYGEVYAMDWGLARVLGQEDGKDIRIRPEALTSDVHSARHERTPSDAPLITMDGDVVGTPSYMSPEQAQGRLADVGPHSDVYSAGAILYHLLAGHPPYVEAGMRVSNHAIWYQAQKGPPTPLHQLAPDAPAELVAICDKAMARDWRARYADMSHLAEDLSAFLEHRVVHAYRTGAVVELRKWIARNQGLAGALAAGMLVLLGWLATSLALKAVAEDRLEEIVRLSALQDLEDLLVRADGLWPADPGNIDGYLTWLEEAQALAGDLPLHRARRAELRGRALPRTAEERRSQRESHPEHAALASLEGEIAGKRRTLLGRRDGVEAELPALDPAGTPADPGGLTARAWELVSPERGRLGAEPLGLALALRALAIAPEDPDAARAAAWGWFALGRDDMALDTGFAAVGAAPEERRAEFEDSLARLEEAVASASTPEALLRLEAELPALEARRRELEARVDEQRDWRFVEGEREARWWNNQLTKLIDGLERLEREMLAPEGFSAEHGWSVARRLTFARALDEGFGPAGDRAAAWREALPLIGAAYPGLELEPQLGLVPIGPDPSSGLWEFAHLQSGEVPRRDARGELELGEGSGLVFVLLRGGSFAMGAQASDPAGRNHDPAAMPDEGPVHDVRLAPFFLSKFEMTQGQWLRCTGSNPSFHPPGAIPGGTSSLLHPVEMVSWFEAERTLWRLGLLLPTEAQWEYAARGGTTTPWWTGEERESLRDTVNLADRTAARVGAPWFTPADWPDLNDGYAVHAPVDTYRPNPFGLFNVHANVAEWCREPYGFYDVPARDGDGERQSTGSHRVFRGGRFDDVAVRARSAYRPGDVPEYRSHAVGLRPVRRLDP